MKVKRKWFHNQESSFLYRYYISIRLEFFFFFQAEDGIRDLTVTGVQTCALPIYSTALQAICFRAPVRRKSSTVAIASAISAKILCWIASGCVLRGVSPSGHVQIGRASCRERV